jgi:hypothetical protein
MSQPASVEEMTWLAEHLLVGSGPVEVAGLVGDVPVEGRDHRVDWLGHAQQAIRRW